MKMLKIAEIKEDNEQLTPQEKDAILTEVVYPCMKIVGINESGLVKEKLSPFWESWRSFKFKCYYWISGAILHIQQDFYGSSKITPEDIWDTAYEHEIKQKNDHESLMQIGKEELAKEDDPAMEKALWESVQYRKKSLQALYIEVSSQYTKRVTANIMSSLKNDPTFLSQMFWHLLGKVKVEDISPVLELDITGGQEYLQKILKMHLKEYVNPGVLAGGLLQKSLNALLGVKV